MPCTTILVGSKASYNGATIIARNDDSGAGNFMPKKWVVVNPEEQPKTYVSVLSHVRIPLPENPLRYTAMPNAVAGEGIWAAGGINEANVGMTASETITTNERVLAADPLVEYQPADKENGIQEVRGGIGEEDLVSITLPYIKTAREGVIRLGMLHEKYGTYESNAIAFSDVNEIWWFESIGGHHWIAKRVPDDSVVIMPNQLGIDYFDLTDALGEGENYLCSRDLGEFLLDNHLALEIENEEDEVGGAFNPRLAFGSHDDSDHVYNTPRAWFMARYLNPNSYIWDGPEADFTPESDDIPWDLIPERKITSEDVKYLLSSHYQGTPYDPYAGYRDHRGKRKYRSIGINRTDFMGMMEIRPDAPAETAGIEWIAYGSNAFNTMVPFFANVQDTPAYFKNTNGTVSTESFYWTSRLIAVLADSGFPKALFFIEDYQMKVQAKGRQIIKRVENEILSANGLGRDTKASGKKLTAKAIQEKLAAANEEIAAMVKKEAEKTLKKVLDESSNKMRNQYARSDV